MRKELLALLAGTGTYERIEALLEQAYVLGRRETLVQQETVKRSIWGGIAERIAGIVQGVSQQQDEPSMDNGDYADMVAATETQNAVQRGVLDIYNEYGLPVVWIAENGACPTCQTNAESGVQAAGNTFPSGDDAPPAHPNCRCQLASADEGE